MKGAGWTGIFGLSTATDDFGIGVYGSSSAITDGESYGGYFVAGDHQDVQSHGVYAAAANYGVKTNTYGHTGTVYGVHSTSVSATALNYGVYGESDNFSIYGFNASASGVVLGGNGNHGAKLIELKSDFETDVEFRVTNAGAVQADGAFSTPAADLAERIDSSESLEPGDVVAIDADSDATFRLSRDARSPLVTGVISTLPGVLLNDRTLASVDDDARPALALAGQVPVKVTAENGPIERGPAGGVVDAGTRHARRRSSCSRNGDRQGAPAPGVRSGDDPDAGALPLTHRDPGEPGRDRTYDQLVKSQLLYH